MLQEFYIPHELLHSVRGLVTEIKVFFQRWNHEIIKFLVKPLLHKKQKMSQKWQLHRSIFLKAIVGIQYNFKIECRMGHIFMCWCSFACHVLSQNHLNSFPEHREEGCGIFTWLQWKYNLKNWLEPNINLETLDTSLPCIWNHSSRYKYYICVKHSFINVCEQVA